jgi:hypothetical protein
MEREESGEKIVLLVHLNYKMHQQKTHQQNSAGVHQKIPTPKILGAPKACSFTNLSFSQ